MTNHNDLIRIGTRVIVPASYLGMDGDLIGHVAGHVGAGKYVRVTFPNPELVDWVGPARCVRVMLCQ